MLDNSMTRPGSDHPAYSPQLVPCPYCDDGMYVDSDGLDKFCEVCNGEGMIETDVLSKMKREDLKE